MSRPVTKFVVLILAFAAFIGIAVSIAWAQTTVLQPNMTTLSVDTTGVMAALPSNPTRKAVTVCNGHATQIATVTLGTLSPVSLTVGIVLQTGRVASSCQTFGNPGGPAGGATSQVNIIANGATTPVTFVEYF